MPITITEALAEIKTIAKRVEKKRLFVQQNLGRQDGIRDPHQANGGSQALLAQERQAIGDLGTRVVQLRRGIAGANVANSISINGETRSIQDWLTWRREIAPGHRQWLGALSAQLAQMRSQAVKQGNQVVGPGQTAGDDRPAGEYRRNRAGAGDRTV